MPTPIVTRVLVADDHEIVRQGLKLVLSAEPDLNVIAEAADGEEAVQRALHGDIDLAILDISMPRKTGLQAARELGRRRPELRILILSMYDNEQFLFEEWAKFLFQSLNEIRDSPIALKVRFARLMQLSDIGSDVCEGKIGMLLPLLRFAKSNQCQFSGFLHG